MATLVDLEELAGKCRTGHAREHILEAVRCYQGGAYSAAIVATWIAVVFDLIDKIHELALAGDADAAALEGQFLAYQKQIEEGNEQGKKSALEFERNILAPCRDKLQLFTQTQMVDLERLREDRHRCAHPAFLRVSQPYRASAEQSRLHIRNAVMNVLAQPPVQGKAALDGLAGLVASKYFPEDTALAVAQLRASAFSRPTEALIRSFVDRMIIGFCDPDSPLNLRGQTIAGISASMEMHRVVAEPRVKYQLDRLLRTASDDHMLAVVVLVGNMLPVWPLLEQSSRDKIVAFIETAEAGDVIKAMSVLVRNAERASKVNARIKTLYIAEIGEAIESYELGSLAKSRTLELLAESRQWVDTNEILNKGIHPIFDTLDSEDIKTIIMLPVTHGADLPGASAYSKLIQRVRGKKMFDEAELNKLLNENKAGMLATE